MNGECYFCHGLVLADESEDIVLQDHGDHRVFLHRQCAAGYNVIETRVGPSSGADVVCPVCGDVESL
ncbi:hypothetical protein NDI56_17415 [Haloarcula sp. S1CR25-12]|uniref:Uncharacterized protein n=1 Tax=Haloarcula saliterrae TaxID=2950534 RepID=A0ABU2FFZ5_9EURY|nr:hypothetical protein [Haloarcula sp. S1CR25-12]MDS0261182.1 hypothetical protein [Haloarcula sp. S1CR25-12]